MMRTSRVLIVSTTYMLPNGAIYGHVQDPISELKFRSWFASGKGSIVYYWNGEVGKNATAPCRMSTFGLTVAQWEKQHKRKMPRRVTRVARGSHGEASGPPASLRESRSGACVEGCHTSMMSKYIRLSQRQRLTLFRSSS
jgi:hypothetical protein